MVAPCRAEVRYACCLAGLKRYIATPRLSKPRLFVWLDHDVVPDNQIIVVARDDDYTFGVLHSRVHELWALAMGTQLETRPRYTPTTTFETFPFPHPTDEQREAIAAAARRLNELREGWLNPAGAEPEELETRTLTNLYNQMPAWLRDATPLLTQPLLTPTAGATTLAPRRSSRVCWTSTSRAAERPAHRLR